MEIISICLSDIPKERITTASNGKKYINLVVDKKRETDRYGNTHTVYISQSKEEREAKKDKIYVGNGKEYIFNNQQQSASVQENESQPSEDDLPF